MKFDHTSPNADKERPQWYGKPYYSLDAWCKNTYGRKLYKVALESGCSCPNRDGTLGYGGCIFCSAGGSGDFAAPCNDSVRTQIDQGKLLLQNKWLKNSSKNATVSSADEPDLIAYFQSYTNTYGDPDRLTALFSEALDQPDVAGISIGTRPDCLQNEMLENLVLLKETYSDKFIWIELGLQTIHDRTAELIHRGYPTAVFIQAMEKLQQCGLPVIVHTILGLPGEDKEDILATMQALNKLHPFGIKLQLLHFLRGTALADLYDAGKASDLTKEEYLELVTDCIAVLDPSICIHRITGDGPKDLLIAPRWSLNKRDVLNSIHALLKKRGIYQGKGRNDYHDPGTSDTL